MSGVVTEGAHCIYLLLFFNPHQRIYLFILEREEAGVAGREKERKEGRKKEVREKIRVQRGR